MHGIGMVTDSLTLQIAEMQVQQEIANLEIDDAGIDAAGQQPPQTLEVAIDPNHLQLSGFFRLFKSLPVEVAGGRADGQASQILQFLPAQRLFSKLEKNILRVNNRITVIEKLRPFFGP